MRRPPIPISDPSRTAALHRSGAAAKATVATLSKITSAPAFVRGDLDLEGCAVAILRTVHRPDITWPDRACPPSTWRPAYGPPSESVSSLDY